jgi:hypothetical protein
MLNRLISKGIIHKSGEINKDKISLVSGAVTLPFAEMIWIATNGDRETINHFTGILVSMNTPTDQVKLFKIIQMLYGLLGLQFDEEAVAIATNPKALEYFLFSFIADFGEIMQEYITEAKNRSPL